MVRLQKQARKSACFIKEKEELKTYDVNMFLMEMIMVDAQLVRVEEKCGIANAQLNESKDHMSSIKNGI